MKVLFLTYDIPYPLVSGGKIRAYYLIKNLARNHQITLFSYYRDEAQKKYIDELKKYCPKIFLFKRRRPWVWQNIVRSLLTSLPFTSATYHSDELKKTLIEELKQNGYDLVHFESFYPALYLPLAKKMGVKTLLGNENIEWQVYDRYASQQFLPIKWLLRLEIFRMRLFEENLWREANTNIALSENDAQKVEKITKKECPVIPNGVDVGVIRPLKNGKSEGSVIFVGTLIYQANNDAVKFFLSQIYPKIKKTFPKVKFVLVSWYKPNWLNDYLNDKSITFIQDKEKPAGEFFAKADVLIAPIRVASGTRIKILEAMAAGLPVVTTSVGIEGIEANVGEEVIIADDPQNFANQVSRLLLDSNERRKIGLAGRKLVEGKYNWTKIVHKLDNIYRKISDEKRN